MLAAIGSRLAAYLSLTKPRLVLAGAGDGRRRVPARAARQRSARAALIAGGDAASGTALVAGGAGALNQWLERDRDARMRRTASRALPERPAGSVGGRGLRRSARLAGDGGLARGGQPAGGRGRARRRSCSMSSFTRRSRRWTTLNTVIGAIPGALPPVIGWAAATGRLGVEAWALFLIVFLWQFPHFLAIAWIYRDDYQRAGFRMLTVGDTGGRMTGCQAVSYALALIPAGLLPAMVGLAGPVYFAGALLLGLLYLVAAARFWLDASDRRARRLLRASFVYLPAILFLLLLNPVPY